MKAKTIKNLIIVASILIWLIILLACSNQREIVKQYQRAGVQPCGVCGSKKAK